MARKPPSQPACLAVVHVGCPQIYLLAATRPPVPPPAEREPFCCVLAAPSRRRVAQDRQSALPALFDGVPSVSSRSELPPPPRSLPRLCCPHAVPCDALRYVLLQPPGSSGARGPLAGYGWPLLQLLRLAVVTAEHALIPLQWLGYSAESCGYCKDASTGYRTPNSRKWMISYFPRGFVRVLPAAGTAASTWDNPPRNFCLLEQDECFHARASAANPHITV